MNSTARFQRQTELVPRSAIKELTATVLGVGAIGRQVALQLASLGVTQLALVDFDHVEPTNITTQGYLWSDLGLSKVAATAQAVAQIDVTIAIERIEDRYRPQLPLGDAVFCCVDSISARAAIWRSAGPRCRFWCDGRMLGETMRILTAAGDADRAHYQTTLFAPGEAQQGACTARGVIYTGSIAAGLMVHQFTRWLRKLPVDRDVAFNLLAAELLVV